jgi:CubicO group peptidase (beta-lactamase class C family)
MIMELLKEFIDKVREQNWNIYGIEVFKDGRVIGRHDFVPEARHPIYSATKSFTSTALGIAAREGLISVDEPILKYLEQELYKEPQEVVHKELQEGLHQELHMEFQEGFHQELHQELQEGLHQKVHNNLHKECSREFSPESLEALKLPVKRFLTMSVTGYPFRPEGPDWMQYSLSCKVGNPEPRFHYSNIPAYLVGAAVENAVGGNLYDYLTSRLFEPLGIDKPVCRYSPEGHFYGASGMELTVHELSLLGQLYLQKGMYGGKRILSEAWVTEATDLQIMNREGGYGYYFWKYNGGYGICGKNGQRCYVFPDKNLMITFLSDLPRESEAVIKAMQELIVDWM